MANERERGYFGQQDVLTLTKRQTSLTVSALILMLFFVFMAGYFWGKRSAFGEFVQRASQDSFADQIYYASLSCAYGDQQPSEQEELASEEEMPDEKDQPEKNMPVEERSSDLFYAQLVGFGTQRAAQQCVARLVKKGITTLLKKRFSTTAQGKRITWYQVVTPPFADKEKLDTLVQQIKRLEKIKNHVRIVTAA